ncbi:muscleblind-like protein 2 [Monomorium pharaonis]|uniref:muscleblind-like protein 2 n=1 Tax=Monomorium pharaonis TaxID=307658 RepID=UPI001745DBBF|nr:muscleblind-like protein 2 [Monomorium pharaonis]
MNDHQKKKKLPILLEKKKPFEHCLVCCMWIALAALATVGAQMVPQNAHCVVYTDSCGQLLDTLPVCQDFNRQVCNRPACKFIHLSDGNVEVIENRVTVCRDAVKGACMRPQCKYYHIPVALPPAPLMAIASSASP